jgi:chromate transporter
MSDRLSESASKHPTPVRARPTLGELFVAFSIVSLSGFGGVLAWSRRMLVEIKGWMTPEEFNDAYALSQLLPGPNVVNLSVVFGSRIRGASGAAVALLGLMGPPVAIVSLLGLLYARFGEIAAVRNALSGVAAAAAGLVIGTAAKMAQPLFGGGLNAAPVVALTTFVAIGVLRWPLHWVLLVMLPLSIVVVWWERR